MRLVLDTNVVVSGLLWNGAPRQLVDAAFAKRVGVFTCLQLQAELIDVLERGKFVEKLLRSGHNAASLADSYAALAYGVALPPVVPAVCRDPKDDVVLACAVSARADGIVSGDRDLLVLRSYMNIPIETPADVWRNLRRQSP